MNIKHPDSHHIPGLKTLWKEAFGDSDSFIDTFLQTAFAPQRCLCIVDGDVVAAAAYWFDCAYPAGKAAYIYAVATATSHRGQGCCRMLMDAIARLLARQGYVCAILVPGDEGLARMYEGMGYRFFGGMTVLQTRAEGRPAAISEITAEEYALARRQMLPAGGVVQEGENLAFLRRHFRFYQGEDFLMAATTEQNALFAPELLGDSKYAPQILAAMGVEKGTFRIPGGENFAMCHMLCPEQMPGYFGFAFD